MTTTEGLDSEVAADEEADLLAPPPSLRSGATHLAASKAFELVTRLATSVVLARLLEPRDFGLLGLVGIFMVLLQRTVGDGGTMHALVQRERVSPALTSSVFWFNVAVGALTTTVLVVAAPVISGALGDDDATSVLRALAFTFLLLSFAKVPQAVLRRAMRYRAIAALGTLNALLTAVVAAPLAVAGHGVASLVAGQLVAIAVEVVLTFVTAGWRPTTGFRRAELRSVTGFARNMAGFNLVNYLSDAGDKFIIGRFVGTAALGIYNLPYRVLLAPIFALGQVFRELLLPVFSRNQHDHEAIARTYLRAVASLSFVTFPVCALIAALGSPLVDVGLGEKWHEAGPVLSVMAVVALELSILVTGSVILTAKGRTDILLRWGVAAGIVNFTCYAIGAQWGVMGVAVGFLVGTTILAHPAMALPFRQIGLPVRRLVAALAPATTAIVPLAGAALLARVLLEQAGHGDLVVLLVGSSAGGLAFLVTVLVLRPAALGDLLAGVRSRLRPS